MFYVYKIIEIINYSGNLHFALYCQQLNCSAIQLFLSHILTVFYSYMFEIWGASFRQLQQRHLQFG